jgi:hypothetical protein
MERKNFELRFAALKQESENWKPQWKDLSRFILPSRGSFDENPQASRTPDYKSLIDGTSTWSARTLASGMMSGLTSPARPWFKMGLADTDLMAYQPVRLYLDECERRIMATFGKSNIYGALYSVYEEVGGFGTAAMAVMEDFKDVIRAQTFTVGEYFLAVGHDGRVNGWAREYWVTVGQLINDFGIENVSEQSRTAYQNGRLEQWVQVRHLIEENDDRLPEMADAKNMPFRSVYWEVGAHCDSFLRRSGFEEFPMLTPRWQTTRSTDPYGRGPGWDALGDIRMLQKMQRDKLIALDKVVDPPVQADVNIQGEVNSLPGGVSRSSSSQPNAGARALYQINPDFAALEGAIGSTKQAIHRTFYADLFLLVATSDRRQMTAREVVEKHEEKLLMLGPVLDRLEHELLDPLIGRTYNIMRRMSYDEAGNTLPGALLPPLPRELEGMDIKIEYISMLAQAQKMVGTTSIEQTAGFIGNLAGAKPEVLDTFDADEAARRYADMLGAPPKIIRSAEEVAKIRAQRAKAQEAAAAAQNAGAMVQGAKLLSETPLGGNSALDAVLGTGGDGL